MDIEEKVEQFLIDHQLTDKVLLVAFSGGWDSMCLLNILAALQYKYNFKPVAIHLNHNWRGEESKAEEENCKEFCKTKCIEFYSETLCDDVPKTETAAREARYNFFKSCAKKFKSRYVLTAHNFNDNAETILYRIVKGTGVAGLSGINAIRDMFFRPLLDVSRKEIENYCIANSLSPNNDSSNNDTLYNRNFLRHEILPLMKKINKDAECAINSLGAVATLDNSIIEEYLDKIKSKIFDKDKIITCAFEKLSKAVKSRLIREILIENNINYERKKIEDIICFIETNKYSKCGKTLSLSDSLQLFVSAEYIDIICVIKFQPICLKIDKEGVYAAGDYIFSVKKFNGEINTFPQDKDNCAYAEINEPLNFEFRTRKEGDKIYPLGLDGGMKLKKYLISKNIPKHERDRLLFLAGGSEILWAPSLGISDKIKVVNRPTHVLKLIRREEYYED